VGQRKIDIAQNLQRAGGVGYRLANVFDRNNYFTHGALFDSTTLYRACLFGRHCGDFPGYARQHKLRHAHHSDRGRLTECRVWTPTRHRLGGMMEQRLAKEKVTAKVVNASISGDTTSGGRSRLPACCIHTAHIGGH
jgi:hypothetical protein